MHKNITLILIALTLASCNTQDNRVKNPTPDDVQGRWETILNIDPIPYLMLEFGKDGNGIVIAASEDGADPIINIHSFVTKESTFLISVEEILPDGDVSEDEEPGTLEGRLEDGILCFELTEPEKESVDFGPVCFIRVGEIEKHRAMAIKVADEL